MSRRRILALIGVVLFAWLAGLALFVPAERLEPWLTRATRGKLAWRGMELGPGGLVLTGVRVIPPLFTPEREIERLTLRPLLLPLLSGRLGAAFGLRLDPMTLDGTIVRSGEKGRLEWRLQVGDLARLAPLWLGPLGAELHGSGAGGGWFEAGLATPTLEAGEWELPLRQVTAFGAGIDPLTLTGTVKEKNRMEIRLSGKGDVALSGRLLLQELLPAPLTAPISGEIQIQPIKPNLPGLAGQLLAKGHPVRLLLSGTLETPQWRVQ